MRDNHGFLNHVGRIDSSPQRSLHSYFQQSLQIAVERAGTQMNLIVRPRKHIFDDGVAVPVLVGQGQKDMKNRG